MKTEQTTFIYQNCTLPVLEALADINPRDLLRISQYNADLYIERLHTVVKLYYSIDENTLYITEAD